MPKILIFGNSGSGKSTLSKEYVNKLELAHLDLDTIAWQDTKPVIRKPLVESAELILSFIKDNKSWVIEGCYADLLALVIESASEIIFLNPGVEICVKNCHSRPWEPHKYSSFEEQNKNLQMLISWVEQYPIRNDEFSLLSHQALFDKFIGKKRVYTSNERNLTGI